jgi:hypothetical protein
MDRRVLRDDRWERIAPLLPGKATDCGASRLVIYPPCQLFQFVKELFIAFDAYFQVVFLFHGDQFLSVSASNSSNS